MVTKEGAIDAYKNLQYNLSTAVTIATIVMLFLAFIFAARIFNISLFDEIMKFFNWTLKTIGKIVFKKETKYNRDLEVGKITEKQRSVKLYRFLNDLIIDLDLKKKGTTPYSFLFMFMVSSLLISILLAKIVFNSIFIGILLTPFVLVFTISVAYTRANIAHDIRIEGILESENIIANNIKDGVLTAVTTNIHVLPAIVKDDFQDFLDLVIQQNVYIGTALLELNMNLGSIADDFIKKCIIIEQKDAHGIEGMFQDIVEINNIKTELRTEMKRKFEEVQIQYIIGATGIICFMVLILWLYPTVLNWYITTIPGQLILAFDMLLIMAEFVYLTYLRAKEL